MESVPVKLEGKEAPERNEMLCEPMEAALAASVTATAGVIERNGADPFMMFGNRGYEVMVLVKGHAIGH